MARYYGLRFLLLHGINDILSQIHHGIEGSDRFRTNRSPFSIATMCDDIITPRIHHLSCLLGCCTERFRVEALPVGNSNHFNLFIVGQPGFLQGSPEISVDEGNCGTIEHPRESCCNDLIEKGVHVSGWIRSEKSCHNRRILNDGYDISLPKFQGDGVGVCN